MFGLFGGGKKEAPKPKTLLTMSREELDEAHKAVKKDLQAGVREIDRQMFGSKTTLKAAQKKLETAVKKKEDKAICKMYAKNVLQARGGMERLMKHKTKLQDVQYSIDDIFSNIKLTKTMGNSSQVMNKIAQLTNITEINSIAMNLQTNLTKMGVVSEMVEDAMDDMNDDMVGDDADVDKLLDEVQDKVDPTKVKAKQGAQQMEEKDDLDDMLNDLKS